MSFLSKSVQDDVGGTRAGRGLGVESSSAWLPDEYRPNATSTEKRRPAQPFGASTQAARRGDRLVCANLECAAGWKAPWRSRHRPIFEQQWGCTSRCLQAIIQRSLRRERGGAQLSFESDPQHRHRVPLGLLMLEQGWITRAQLRTALETQRSAGYGRIGAWLTSECGIPSAHIARGLALQWSCPLLTIEGFAPVSMALNLPRIFVEELGIVPLRIAGSRLLYVAFKDHLDASASFALGQMSGLKVESGLLDDAHFQAAHSRLLQSTFVEVKQERCLDIDTLSAKIATVLEQCQPVASRLVRVHQHFWLRTWLETGCYSGVGTLPSTSEDVADTIFTLGSSA